MEKYRSQKRLIRVAAAVIVNDEGQVLITRRPEGSHLGGLWEFPGGKIKDSETPQMALQREIKEELDVEVDVRQLLWREQFEYPEKRIDIFFYGCRLKSAAQQIKALEVDAFRWINPDQLDAFQFPPADEHFIARLKKGAFDLINGSGF